MKKAVTIFTKLLQSINGNLPENIRHAVLVKRRTRHFRNVGVVFIHIPKAAGSSVNEALYGQFMGHYSAELFMRMASAEIKKLPRFAIARNPWSRVVSAYRFAKLGAGMGGHVTAGIRNAAQYQIPEFDSFERFVKEWLPRQNLEKTDGVFRLQTSYILNLQGDLLVDHVGRLEDLAPTLLWLKNNIPTPISIPRSNLSGEPVHYRELYSHDTAEIVKHLYQKDISFFNYQF